MSNPVNGRARPTNTDTPPPSMRPTNPKTVNGQALAAGSKTHPNTLPTNTDIPPPPMRPANPKNVSGTALAAGSKTHPNTTPPTNKDSFPLALFLTWTTYGAWLPGDRRGWRPWKRGEQPPQPLLEDWCRDRMKEPPVLLTATQRQSVENIIREHATIRGWKLHAVSARSNHIHVVVSAVAEPKQVRDQFKANATRILRAHPRPITNKKVWAKGGDIEFIDTDDELEQVVNYVNEAQDRMDRDQ